MNSKENNCRRSFLKKGLALTAGLTLIGSGLKLHASTNDDWRWVGYCGIACDDTCSWFKNNQCPSCKSINYDCTLQDCAKAKNVDTCAHCSDLETCEDEYWTSNPDQYEVMKDLKVSLGLTGVNNQFSNKKKISVFPNPAKDYLIINNPANALMAFQLVSINGKVVKSGMIDSAELSIDISDVKPGNYVLKLQRNKATLKSHKIAIL